MASSTIRNSVMLILPVIIFHVLIDVTQQDNLKNTTANVARNNSVKLELTTVKIAEITSKANTTLIVKEFTAKYYTTSTPMSKVILIPPANHSAQIQKRKNTSWVFFLLLLLSSLAFCVRNIVIIFFLTSDNSYWICHTLMKTATFFIVFLWI